MTKSALNLLSALFFVLLGMAPQSDAKATPKKKSEAQILLQDMSKKYRSSKMAKIETEKKVTSELMGRTTTYKGVVYLAKGKFRWENETPEKSLLLFDGDIIWNVQYPPEDLGGPVQVARAKLDKNTKSQILISTLIGNEPIDKNFEVLSEKSEGDVMSVELKPKSNDLRVRQLVLDVEKKEKLISKVSYKDDVDNLTVVDMKKTEFTKEDKKLFQYKPPKDAQVTNL